MKQVLLSSVLVGLLSVSAINAVGVSPDSNNNVAFTDTTITDSSTELDKQTNTLDLSGSSGVYKAVSSENTITLESGVQFADIQGGVLAEDTKKIIFDFQGAPQGKDQVLNFGSNTNANSKIIQAKNGGEIIFDFNGDGTSDNTIDYTLKGAVAGAGILNDGEMTFNLAKYSNLMFDRDIVNQNGSLFINFDDGSNFQYNQSLNIVNSGSGKTTLKFKDFANRARLTVNEVELQNGSTGSIELIFENASAELQTAFKNNKTTTTKNDFVFNLKGNSFVLLENHDSKLGGDTPSNLKDIAFSFSSSGNKLALFVSASNGKNGNFDMKWLDVNGSDNCISLAPLNLLGSHIVYTDMLFPRKNNFTFLEIGDSIVSNSGISGSGMNFIVYANISKKEIKYNSTHSRWSLGQDIQADSDGKYTYSDRVIIHSSQDNTKSTIHNLGVVVTIPMLKYLDSVSYTPKSDTEKGDVTTKGNIAVATVANASNVKLNALSGTLLGFNLIETSFEEVQTNAKGVIDGTNGYTTYFLKSAKDSGVAPITQEVTSSVFALNYDLFIANFNSLNKRMGDLRNNPYSQGAWGRIFNGQLSNDFGLGSSNNYTTLQAGYDYDFSLSNAKNYLGVAFAYGFSISEMSSNASNALQSREIKDIFSNNIELALYNAYVEDSGLYSDSIAKFSYLMSSFNLTNNGVSESLNVNNYAFQLSEEVGCVFTLGESKEWSITPQAELSFGYYSDSDLTQVAGDFYLDAKAKSMLMLRARVGTMVGYDFKQYTQDKDISTTLYAGLSYEYDYLSGGDIELTPNIGKATTTKSALSSDGRGVLNLGTNITLKDDIRLYADFQTSFGGKINTDYQINIGARFSFGERGEEQKDREEAPLKIER